MSVNTSSVSAFTKLYLNNLDNKICFGNFTLQHLIIYPIGNIVTAFEERGYNVSFSPCYEYIEQAKIDAEEIIDQRNNYLEILEF